MLSTLNRTTEGHPTDMYYDRDFIPTIAERIYSKFDYDLSLKGIVSYLTAVRFTDEHTSTAIDNVFGKDDMSFEVLKRCIIEGRVFFDLCWLDPSNIAELDIGHFDPTSERFFCSSVHFELYQCLIEYFNDVPERVIFEYVSYTNYVTLDICNKIHSYNMIGHSDDCRTFASVWFKSFLMQGVDFDASKMLFELVSVFSTFQSPEPQFLGFKLDEGQMDVFQGFFQQIEQLATQGVAVNHSHSLDFNKSLVIDLTVIGAFCYSVYAKNHTITALSAIALMTRYTKFGKFAVELIKKIGDVDDDGEEVVAQGPASKGILGFSGALFVYKCIDSLGWCCSFKDVVNTVLYNLTTSFSQGVKGPVEGLISLLATMVEKIYCFATGESECPYDFITGPSREARQILSDVAEIEVMKRTNAISTVEVANLLELNLDKLQKVAGGLDMNSALGNSVKQTISSLRLLLVDAKTLVNATASERAVPVAYIFVGGPGIGKTMFIDTISDIVTLGVSSEYMKEQYKKEPHLVKSSKFSFNQTEQHCSGYRNQPVALFDELDPNPQVPGIPSGPQVLIKAINSTAYPLTMADLGSKGTTFFTSKVILGTTNHENWANLSGISCPGAFYRRVKFVHSVFDHGAFARDYPHIPRDRHIQADKQRKMVLCTAYKAGKIPFAKYFDDAYKYVTFSVKQLTPSDTSVSGGIRKSSTQIIADIVEECSVAEKEKQNRDALSSNIIKDYINGDLLACLKQDFEIEYKPEFDFDVDLSVPTDELLDNLLTGVPDLVEAQGPGESVMTFYGLVIAAMSIYITNPAKRAVANLTKKPDPQITYETSPREHSELYDQFMAYVRERTSDKRIHLAFSSFPDKVRAFQVLGIEEVYQGPHWEQVKDVMSETEVLWHKACDHVMKSKIEKLTSSVKKTMPWLGVTISVASLAAVGAGIAMLFSHMKGRTPEPQGDYPLREKNKAKTKFRTQRVSPDDLVVAQGEGSSMAKVIRNNFYRVKLHSPRDIMKDTYTYFLMVQNNLAIVPQHVLDAIHDYYVEDNEAVMEISGCLQLKNDEPSMKRQVIPLANYVVKVGDDFGWDGGITQFGTPYGPTNSTTDLCLISVELTGKNIVKNLPSLAFYENFEGYRDSVLVTLDEEQRPVYSNGWTKKQVSSAEVTHTQKGVRKSFSDKLWQYDMITESGDCGAPHFVVAAGQYMLSGVHIAGTRSKTFGYSIFISKEDVESAISIHTQRSQPQLPKVLIEPDVEEQVEAQFSPYGLKKGFIRETEKIGQFGHQVYASAQRPTLATKSKLQKSPMYKLLTNTQRYIPAYLRTMDNGIDPMMVAQNGYGCVEISPNFSLASLCATSYWSSICHFERAPFEVEPLSFERAVAPGEEWEFVRKVSRKTSPGYPYALLFKKGKKDFFGDSDEYAFNTEPWKEAVREMTMCEQQILAGQRPIFIFMSFLKDERRPVEKAIQGKTRLVSGAPMTYTILLRKYTLGFINWFTRNKVTTSAAIGVNPYSQDWTSIANHHGYYNKFDCESKRTFAGDFSGYDKKLHYVWVCMLNSMMNWFYDDAGTDQHKIRNALIDELARTRHVVGGEIVEWIGSNSSGNPLTTVLNSIANVLMIRYVSTHLFLEHAGVKPSEHNFLVALEDLFGGENGGAIRCTVFGDDNVISVMPGNDFGWFLPQEYGKAFDKLLGVSYTDESKDGIAADLRSIDEVTFLKRGFAFNSLIPHPTPVFLAPLSIETIIESVRWYRDGDQWMASWVSTIKTALMELSLHSQDDYLKYGGSIVRALSQVKNLPPGAPSTALVKQSLAQREAAIQLCEY